MGVGGDGISMVGAVINGMLSTWVPKSMGGPDWVDNLAVACVPCNASKKNGFVALDFAQLTRHVRRKRIRPRNGVRHGTRARGPRRFRGYEVGSIVSERDHAKRARPKNVGGLSLAVGAVVFLVCYLALGNLGVETDAGSWSLVVGVVAGVACGIFLRSRK